MTLDSSLGDGPSTDLDELPERLRAAGLRIQAVPEVVDATPADLEQALRQRRGPALFRGLADDWPARSAWTLPRLRSDHGDRQVTALMDLPANGVLFPTDQKNYEQSMPFAQFVDRMQVATAASPCYLAYTRVGDLFPDEDYDFRQYTSGYGDDTDTRVWIGSAGTRSMLHSDLKDNLFCQVVGEKSIFLVPWSDTTAVYPFPDNLVNSRVDLAAVDLGQFPRLRQATVYAGTVRPGDILYMPSGTWHDIRSRTASVSINHWFGPSLQAGDYLRLLVRLGPAYWRATVADFLRHGVLGRREETRFFFSPASTGKRLYDLVRFGNFNRDNDPTT
ncbi:cupin-like domain-containing protein [Micromonospora sp. WMMD1120]|uniref:cupin-like domain-containing protein n=1 Tax=Micromonospora sp. WMMD1120 TaxID=3016106 RepID=UPI0024171B73|nr:cupin-like domain-containing protein [Micromonospora sp. WMMD1120]MDG4810906.1 cupin-like domain-containing protein [Micromonospora sp. WMMD1120]